MPSGEAVCPGLCVDSVVLERDVTARLVRLARVIVECPWEAFRIVTVVLERGGE
jgi:hypothetical protein